MGLPSKLKAGAFTVIAVVVLVVLATTLSNFISSPWYVVESRSMEPVLHVGDLVMAVPVSPEEISAGPQGDIIIYQPPVGKPIIHRVIDKAYIDGTWFFLTKGDNNLLPDQDPYNPYTWVSEDRVIAKMLFSIPLVGFPFLESVKPFTETVLIVALAYLIFTSLSPSRGKSAKKSRR